MMMNKSYQELSRLKTFQERFDYLKLSGSVGSETFGYDRWLNQTLYRSYRWKKFRREIIIRDEGCDLGVDGYVINDPRGIFVHHINPITIEDIENDNDLLFDPNNVICTSFDTHQAIHYGDESSLPLLPIERRPFDTCPWRQ